MQHKFIKLFILTGLLILAGNGFAKKISSADLARTITRATFKTRAEVNISFLWEKVIYARDVMRRPARMGAGKTVIGVDKETTSCKGILIQGNQIITPADCVKNGDFKLQKISLTFANGKTGIGLVDTLRIQEDVAYIPLSK